MIIRKLEEGRLWLFLAGRPPRRQEKRSSRARCMFFLCIKYNSGKIIKLARKDHHQHSPDSTWRRRQMFQSRRVTRERITSKLTWGSFSWSSLSSSSIASPFSAFWGKTWFSRFSCKLRARADSGEKPPCCIHIIIIIINLAINDQPQGHSRTSHLCVAVRRGQRLCWWLL